MTNSYELKTFNQRLDLITEDNLTKLESEINIMQEELENSELFKALESKKFELRERKKIREAQQNLVLEYMVQNKIKKIDNWKGFDIKLKSRSSIETVLLDINEVPNEFLRVKKELDKKKASEFYRETGVMLDGVHFEHQVNYSVELSKSEVRNG